MALNRFWPQTAPWQKSRFKRAQSVRNAREKERERSGNTSFANLISSVRQNLHQITKTRPIKPKAPGKGTPMNKPVLITSALALAFALASCGSTTTNLQTGTALTGQSLSASTAAAINDEAASAASSLTASNAMSDLSFDSASLASSGTGLGIQSEGGKSGSDRNPGFKPGKPNEKCVTITPSPVVDTDGDKVPDSATMTFDCSRDSTNYSASRTGTIQISDPSSIAGEGGFDSVINLNEKRTNKLTGKVVTESRTGERHPRRNGDKITQNHDITIARTVTGESDASIHNVWKLEFSATTAGSIVKGSLLPAGTLSIDGTHTAVRDGVTRTHTVQTPTVLTYDPTCSADIKYVAGVLKVTATGAEKDGSLEIAYGACGTDPVITKNGEAVKVKLPMPSK
jgi:hypothetical protein